MCFFKQLRDCSQRNGVGMERSQATALPQDRSPPGFAGPSPAGSGGLGPPCPGGAQHHQPYGSTARAETWHRAVPESLGTSQTCKPLSPGPAKALMRTLPALPQEPLAASAALAEVASPMSEMPVFHEFGARVGSSFSYPWPYLQAPSD